MDNILTENNMKKLTTFDDSNITVSNELDTLPNMLKLTHGDAFGAPHVVRNDGTLPLTTGHICFSQGHSFYLACEVDNGRSKFGYHKCSRCGHQEDFQYDYNI